MKRLACACLLLAACFPPPPVVFPPKIVSFSASSLALQPGQSALLSWEISGSAEVLAIDNGVGEVTGTKSFLLGPLDKTTTFTLTASSRAGSDSASLVINVQGAGASTRGLTAALPALAARGAPLTLRVKAVDAAGATSTGFLGAVHFTSTDAAAALPNDTTFTAADAGAHDFAVTFNTNGAQTVTATSGALTITSNPCAVSATGPVLARLTFAGVPAAAATGAGFGFTVTAQDAANGPLAGYRGHLVFSSTDPAAAFPAAYDFTAADNGAHAFNATLNTAGAQRLTATDVAAAVTVTSPAVAVTTPVPGVQLAYTDPAPGGKVRLVRNAASTSTTVVMDLVVNASLAGYSATLNLPLSGSRVAPSAGPIAKGNSLDPGSAPAALALALPSSGPLAGVLVTALSQKAAGTGAVVSDAALVAGMVLYTLKLDFKAGAPVGTVFDGAAPGALFRASLRNKLGAEVAGQADFNVGKLEVR